MHGPLELLFRDLSRLTYVFYPPHIRELHTLFMRIIAISTDSRRGYSTVPVDAFLLAGNMGDESSDIKKLYP